MGNLINLTGKTFGLWTVLNRSGRDGQHIIWRCRCTCGTARDVLGYNLRYGVSTGCGCDRLYKTTHGHKRRGKQSRTYSVWKAIKVRVNPKNFRDVKNYSGRGIKICKRWLRFENFLEDMGECPEHHSIDRIDNNGNYEPDNCRWATHSIQSRNTRRNRWVELRGERLVLKDAARKIGVHEAAIYNEVKRKNISLQRAMEAVAARQAARL